MNQLVTTGAFPPSPSINPIGFKKFYSSIQREADRLAKPKECRLCGKPSTSFCNSHTIPTFVLRQITSSGKVLSVRGLCSPFPELERGLKQVATFHTICPECDNAFFKLYENPEAIARMPSQRILGQIATKTLLYEQSKASSQIELYDILEKRMSFKDAHRPVRQIDFEEDESYLKRAIMSAERGTAQFSILLHEKLSYVAPFAYQGKVDLIADFDGHPVNNLHVANPGYKIEPLYVCIFPLKSETIVIVFHNSKAKRFRELARQLRSRPVQERLHAVVKLVFSYSEEVYISPCIDPSVFGDASFEAAVRMNVDGNILAFAIDKSKKTISEAANERYAIDNLPEVPNLLSSEYALGDSPLL